MKAVLFSTVLIAAALFAGSANAGNLKLKKEGLDSLVKRNAEEYMQAAGLRVESLVFWPKNIINALKKGEDKDSLNIELRDAGNKKHTVECEVVTSFKDKETINYQHLQKCKTASSELDASKFNSLIFMMRGF